MQLEQRSSSIEATLAELLKSLDKKDELAALQQAIVVSCRSHTTGMYFESLRAAIDSVRCCTHLERFYASEQQCLAVDHAAM